MSAAFACAIVSASSFAAAAQELPAGPNRDLVYGNCRTCHDLQYLKESAGLPRDTWTELLDTMKQYGLRIQPDVRAKILDYLATYLGPNPPPASAAAPAASKPPSTARRCFTSNACSAISRTARDRRAISRRWPETATCS